MFVIQVVKFVKNCSVWNVRIISSYPINVVVRIINIMISKLEFAKTSLNIQDCSKIQNKFKFAHFISITILEDNSAWNGIL